MMTLYVGPSHQHEQWKAFFQAPKWSPAEFRALADADQPGAALFEIETFINGLYIGALRAQQMQRIGFPADADAAGKAAVKAQWLAANSAAVREALGPAVRDVDLQMLRWMRRGSCLSAVLGAGAAMDAGGPSWAELVRRLLVLAIESGHNGNQFTPADSERAKNILAAIAAGKPDTEQLMQGAQLCLDLKGQHLFTDITGVLYEKGRKPGPIHRAVAALAAPQHVPDRGGELPGWDAIITYNFDDLMGEALDEAGLARASYAMRGDEIAGDPNEKARLAGRKALHQGVYHLHGYTPRKLFLITKVQYVFSTAQYLKVYEANRTGIIDEVFKRWLAYPAHHALYIGCSFDDDAMNGLLRDAAETMPGRYHYALLRWPGDTPYETATAEEIGLHSAVHEARGVRPLWFDRFEQIPELIAQLA